MATYKLQKPLTFNEHNIYPLTTYDQIIMSDGSRWDGKSGGGTSGDCLDVDLTGAAEGEIALTNADLIDGKTIMDVISLIYPVGSLYMSVNHVDPSILFGGTWEQIQDTFLLAAGTSFDAGSTGGEATHTLTVDEMPAHRHNIIDEVTNTIMQVGKDGSYAGSQYAAFGNSVAALAETTYGIAIAGGNQPHNNMPPYLAVYIWKRIA